MMGKRIVLDSKCLPSRLPSGTLLAIWLLMDRCKAPSWSFGVYWTLVVLFVLTYFYMWAHETSSTPKGFGEQ